MEVIRSQDTGTGDESAGQYNSLFVIWVLAVAPIPVAKSHKCGSFGDRGGVDWILRVGVDSEKRDCPLRQSLWSETGPG